MDAELEDRLGKCITGIYNKFPLLGELLYQCKRIVTPELESWAGVNITSRGMTLYIHPAFKYLTSFSGLKVLKHEMIHFLLNHPARAKYWGLQLSLGSDLTEEKVQHSLKNIALDAVANQLVFADGKGKMPNDGCVLEIVKDGETSEASLVSVTSIAAMVKKQVLYDMQAEYYYNLLKDTPKTAKQHDNGMVEITIGEPGKKSGKGKDETDDLPRGGMTRINKDGTMSMFVDAHGEWDCDMTPSEAEAMLKDAVQRAVNKIGSNWRGLLPAGMLRVIDELIAVKPPDYIMLLRKYLSNAIAADCEMADTYRRPSRYDLDPFILPGRAQVRGGRVGVIVDSSGSVDERQLAITMYNIAHMPDIGEIWFTTCDAQAYDIFMLNDFDVTKKKISKRMAAALKGGGGTDFDPSIIAMVEKVHPDVILYYSDMLCTKPISDIALDKRHKIIWCSTGDMPEWASSEKHWKIIKIPTFNEKATMVKEKVA